MNRFSFYHLNSLGSMRAGGLTQYPTARSIQEFLEATQNNLSTYRFVSKADRRSCVCQFCFFELIHTLGRVICF